MRNKFIRCILTFCFSAAAAGTANAQLGHSKEYVEPPGWSIGMNVGLADLWSDVGTQSIVTHYANEKYWGKPHFMGGLFIRYSAHPALAMRLGGNFGTLYASDEWNKTAAESATSIEDDSYQRYIRNLSVRSITWEANFLFEITPRRLNYESLGARKRFQPFLLLGIGYFHFKPQAKYVDRAGNDRGYVNLYDLHLEGDGLPSEVYKDAPAKYSLWQMEIPMGLGVKWDIGKRLALGIEYLYRYTFTDYIDNVSGNYIDPSLYSHPAMGLSESEAALAAEMADRSWQIDQSLHHNAGEKRGNSAVKDAFSTFGVSVIFKVPSRKTPWWY